MRYLAAVLVYVGFFGLIGLAVYVTGSAWPLLALILTPSMTHSETNDD